MQNIIYNVGSNSYIYEDGICILKFTINSFAACSVSVGLYAKQNGEKMAHVMICYVYGLILNYFLSLSLHRAFCSLFK